MPNPTNHSGTDVSGSNASLDDRLDSLMADMEEDLQRLDAQASSRPVVQDEGEEDSAPNTDDVEASAAQLMRELNDALAAADAEPASGKTEAREETEPEPQPVGAASADDLAALDEALAAGAQTPGAEAEEEASAPEPQQLKEELEPEVAAEDVEPEPEPEPEDVTAAPAPARSKPAEAAPAPKAQPATPTQAPASAPAPAPAQKPADKPEPERVAITVEEAKPGFGARIQSALLLVVRLLSLPLAVLPPTVRDYIGWFGIVTLINAGALWAFWLIFRA